VQCPEHFDGGLEQDDGGGAVYVVVAVEEDGFAGGDGQLESVGGGGHAQHQEGIVKLADLGIEEAGAASAVAIPRARATRPLT
jgi:hypothetical protein